MGDDEGEIRLMGSRRFIATVIERIGSVVEVLYDGNLRANRHGDGHRAHLHVRLAPAPGRGEPGAALAPRAAAEHAKGRRDIAGEIAVLTAADRGLREQAWFPIQPGDVVYWSIAMPDGGRHGQTLVATHDPDHPTEAGAPLLTVSETPYPTDDDTEEEEEEEGARGGESGELDYQDFYDLWFEAGPSRITVIRHGQIIHPAPNPTT